MFDEILSGTGLHLFVSHVDQSSTCNHLFTEEVEETRELLLCLSKSIEELLMKGEDRSTVCMCVLPVNWLLSFFWLTQPVYRWFSL